MTSYASCRPGLAILIACSVLWCSGCSSDFASVKGKVTLDGSPLPDVLVTFTPEHGRASTGRTDQSGNYELSYTFDRLGAETGPHTVRITSAGGAESEAAPTETLPSRYNTDTELKAEVSPGSNEINFDLTSEGPVAPRRPGGVQPAPTRGG